MHSIERCRRQYPLIEHSGAIQKRLASFPIPFVLLFLRLLLWRFPLHVSVYVVLPFCVVCFAFYSCFINISIKCSFPHNIINGKNPLRRCSVLWFREINPHRTTTNKFHFLTAFFLLFSDFMSKDRLVLSGSKLYDWNIVPFLKLLLCSRSPDKTRLLTQTHTHTHTHGSIKCWKREHDYLHLQFMLSWWKRQSIQTL